MEPWSELLKKERNARLLTQQEVAKAIETDARTVRAWESGQSFPSKYFRRKLCAFYGKEPGELGLDKEPRESGSNKESMTQPVSPARAQENGNVITHDRMLPSGEENNGAVPAAFIKEGVEPAPVVPTAGDDRPVADYGDSWHLPPPRRARIRLPLRVGGVILIVILIVAALLGARSIISLRDSRTSGHTGTPGPSLTPPSNIFFGFDGSTQGWGTSEGGFKLAKVSDASSPVYSGNGSLEVTSALIGSGNPHYPGNGVYTHTEATDYFSPHNLGGATVACYVYLPPALAPGGSSPGYIRVFVKDTQYRNDFSDLVTIGPSTVGRWIKLSFMIGANPDNEGQGFDTMQVNAIGVRIDLNDGSMLNYAGPFYIDACSL